MTRWQFSIKFFFAGPHLKLNKLNNPQQAARYLNSAMRFVLKSSPPNVFIGGPVPNPPGFPPKDGCVRSLVANPSEAVWRTRLKRAGMTTRINNSLNAVSCGKFTHGRLNGN